MGVVVAVLALTVAVLAVLVVSLLRSHAEILRTLHDMGHDLDPAGGGQGRPPEPAIGSTVEGVPGSAGALGRAAPDVAGSTPQGDPVVVGVGSGAPVLIAFLSSGCLTCHRFWEAFADGVELPAGERVVVVTRGAEAESVGEVAALASGFGEGSPTVVVSTDTWEDYGVPLAPYFVLVEGGTVVGEGAAATWEQVRDLLGRARADASARTGAGSGERPARSRRSVLTGNRDRIDADLTAAGIRPGDPRLHHDDPAEVGLDPPPRRDPGVDP